MDAVVLNPTSCKDMRACIACRLIQTKEQFFRNGCPTCGDFLRMQEDEGRIAQCTTTKFHGYIALLRPGAFVSRYCGLEKRSPGLYALSVVGKIPDEILHESEVERQELIEEEAEMTKQPAIEENATREVAEAGLSEAESEVLGPTAKRAREAADGAASGGESEDLDAPPLKQAREAEKPEVPAPSTGLSLHGGESESATPSKPAEPDQAEEEEEPAVILEPDPDTEFA